MKKVILKRDLTSKKFDVVFKKGFALNYDEKTKSVEHQTQANVWLSVKETQFEEAKNYVIMGDNNFWYSTTGYVTKKLLEKDIKDVKENIKNKFYDGVDGEPNELYVFETGWSDTIELEK